MTIPSKDYSKDASLPAINALIEQANQAIDASFGKIAGIKVGHKLASATSGTEGEKNFSVTIHPDETAYGVKRAAYNAFAKLGNLALPESQRVTIASVENNTHDITRTINHLVSTFEKLEHLLSETGVEGRPEIAAVKWHMNAIQEKVVGSLEGIHNILITYILDRMPNKERIDALFGKGKEAEARGKEIRSDLAEIFAAGLTSMNDADFLVLSGFQRDPDKSGYPEEAKQKILEKLLEHAPEERVQRAASILGNDLSLYFPVNETHINQLRGIGKLFNSVESLEQHKSTFADLFRQVDGIQEPDGKIRYPDATWWDPNDKLYHYMSPNGDISNETRFTPEQIVVLKKRQFRV